ncbi:MAG: GntR family transcriptional regulator [Succinivibrio sp.]
MPTADLKKDIVYRRIRELIISGAIPMGAKVSEGALEARLHANKAPIRDALKRLQAEHLVLRRPKSGTYVFTLTPGELDDLLHFRFTIESEALKLSLSREWVLLSRELDIVVESMVESLEAGRIQEYLRLDSRFHELIVSHCGNRYYIGAYTLASALMDTVRNCLGTSPLHLQRSIAEHKRMAEAIRARDFDGFMKVFRTHVLAEDGSYWSAQNVGAQLLGEA